MEKGYTSNIISFIISFHYSHVLSNKCLKWTVEPVMEEAVEQPHTIL